MASDRGRRLSLWNEWGNGMAKNESVQRRLQKVRPPRVQMTYDVEIGDAIENKELPFVMGVVGDFGGASEIEQKRLKERQFVGIERDNFDEVMKGLAPRAAYRVTNEIDAQGGQLEVDLTFKSMADFRPESVVAQVEPLRKLLEARIKLADLRNKMAGNDKLEDLLNDVLGSTEKLAALGHQSTLGRD
jgi:type VI secretion system protein ImpB